MSQLERMIIPEIADGIVDDQKQFKKQQEKNEAQLEAEITKSKETDDDLPIDYEEGIEFIPFKETRMSPEQLAKIAKRKQILGHAIFKLAA